MSNTVSMLPVDLDLLLQLVHGPVRDVLSAILTPPKSAWPHDIRKKLGDVCNRVYWLYSEPGYGPHVVPFCYDVGRPFVLWRWALEQHVNEAYVCRKLLGRVDCLNNPGKEFYVRIAIDLLDAWNEEQLQAIYDRLLAVLDSFDPTKQKEPDWSKGYKNDPT